MEDFEITVREAAQRVYDAIQNGTAPLEVVNFYQRMASRKDFSFWLHGFYIACSKDKILLESELFRYLKKQLF